MPPARPWRSTPTAVPGLRPGGAHNKELFENATPYMIVKPSLKGGLHISSGKIPKLIDKLTYIHEPLLKNQINIMTNLYHIHLHLFTSTYEHGDKYE